MAPVTVKVRKDGSIALPHSLRKQLGLETGSLLIVEAEAGTIRLRPAILQLRPPASSEDRDFAIYTLLNSRTREQWDFNLALALEHGAEQAQIDALAPGHRETLPAQAEWAERQDQQRASRHEALHRS